MWPKYILKLKLTLCLHAPWSKMNPIWYCKQDICSLLPCRASATDCIIWRYFFSLGWTTVSLIIDDIIFSVFGALICISLLKSSQVNLNIELYDFSCSIDPDPRLHMFWHSLETILEAADETKSGSDLLIISSMHFSTFCLLYTARQICLCDSSKMNADLSPLG